MGQPPWITRAHFVMDLSGESIAQSSGNNERCCSRLWYVGFNDLKRSHGLFGSILVVLSGWDLLSGRISSHICWTSTGASTITDGCRAWARGLVGFAKSRKPDEGKVGFERFPVVSKANVNVDPKQKMQQRCFGRNAFGGKASCV